VTSSADAVEGYAAAAGELIERYDALSSAAMFAPVADLLERSGLNVLDVGAATGRDAAWFAGRGCRVLAVEPVAAFRAAGQARHPAEEIEWLDDRLPLLTAVRARGQRFDRVHVTAVWQHLNDEERSRAMPVLADLTARGGLLVLSLRHGPGAPGRPCHEVSPSATIAAAAAVGLEPVLNRAAPSLQNANRAAGVHWTWLAFRQPAAGLPHPRHGEAGAGVEAAEE
jgi:SAM-dependent methyltransferase